jgi:hypothetical protein
MKIAKNLLSVIASPTDRAIWIERWRLPAPQSSSKPRDCHKVILFGSNASFTARVEDQRGKVGSASDLIAIVPDRHECALEMHTTLKPLNILCFESDRLGSAPIKFLEQREAA